MTTAHLYSKIHLCPIVLSQRKERDRLLEKDYLHRDCQVEVETFLSSPLIKLINGPRRAGKSVLTLLLLKGKNFAYLNFDDEQLLENFNEDAAMQALLEVYGHPRYPVL